MGRRSPASSSSTCPGSSRATARGPAARRARRAGAGAGRDLPRALELRARGAPEPARPPARAERLGQEHDRRLHDGARSSTTRRSTRGRSTASTGSSRRRRPSAARSASRSGKRGAADASTYAHLADDEIDAKLLVEVRDHPLFLIPVAERQRAPRAHVATQRARPAPEPSRRTTGSCAGQLSHKSQQVFEALLASYHGSYAEVLKHVQVERYFISRRYRVGAVTIGPQLSVDAAERQVTMDRSLAVAAAVAPGGHALRGEGRARRRGRRRCSSSATLLKRPLDAFKYLQLSIETGEVALTRRTCSSTAS